MCVLLHCVFFSVIFELISFAVYDFCCAEPASVSCRRHNYGFRFFFFVVAVKAKEDRILLCVLLVCVCVYTCYCPTLLIFLCAPVLLLLRP
jgi:hypothetical protein